MTMFIVRSAWRIYGPFYAAQDAIDWVEIARMSLASRELPLAVELLEGPEVKVPPVQPQASGKRTDDDDMPF